MRLTGQRGAVGMEIVVRRGGEGRRYARESGKMRRYAKNTTGREAVGGAVMEHGQEGVWNKGD